MSLPERDTDNEELSVAVTVREEETVGTVVATVGFPEIVTEEVSDCNCVKVTIAVDVTL